MSKNQQKPDISQYDMAAEKEKLTTAANEQGLIIPENFYSNLKPGDIIEIYTPPPTNNQIYANDEFKKLCSYTAEQMQTIPFPELFWREPEFNEQLFARAALVVQNEKEGVPWDLPVHELVESLHPRKRTFEMQMGWIAPCFKQSNPKEVGGWASSLMVNLIFEWEEDVN